MQNRNYLFIAAIATAGILFLGATRIRAADQLSSEQATTIHRSIKVSGTAVVYGKPDYATIVVGVTKLAPRVMDSKSACDQAMQKVQAAIRKAGVEQDDIQTIDYEIYPVQEKPTLPRQWKVTHQISVKVRKVAAVANILDVAAGNGATSISSVQYAIEKVLDLRSKARAEAVKVAREKAQELARLNGVQLGEPITISDDSYGGYAAQSYANSSLDYPNLGGGRSDTLSGGQIAVNAREEIEFAIR